jgi:hypothetical protein
LSFFFSLFFGLWVQSRLGQAITIPAVFGVVVIKAKKGEAVSHPFGWDGWERDKLLHRSVQAVCWKRKTASLEKTGLLLPRNMRNTRTFKIHFAYFAVKKSAAAFPQRRFDVSRYWGSKTHFWLEPPLGVH